MTKTGGTKSNDGLFRGHPIVAHLLSIWMAFAVPASIFVVTGMLFGTASVPLMVNILGALFLVVFAISAILIVRYLVRRGEGRLPFVWYCGLCVLSILAFWQDGSLLGVSSSVIPVFLLLTGAAAFYWWLSGTSALSTMIARQDASGQGSAQWIEFNQTSQGIGFWVRQNRNDRLERSLRRLVGNLAGILFGLLALYSGYLQAWVDYRSSGQDFFAILLVIVGFVVSLALVIVTFAGLPALLDGLRARKKPDNMSFMVSPDGVTVNDGQTVVPYSTLAGPYYQTSKPAPQPLTAMQNGSPVVFGGFGVVGTATAALAATMQGLGQLAPTVAYNVAEARSHARQNSSGEVFIRNMGQPVHLARFLSDEQAEFLCTKVAEAIGTMLAASQSEKDSTFTATDALEIAKAAQDAAGARRDGQRRILNINIDE